MNRGGWVGGDKDGWGGGQSCREGRGPWPELDAGGATVMLGPAKHRNCGRGVWHAQQPLQIPWEVTVLGGARLCSSDPLA